MSKTPDDPILDAAIERALAPFAGILPPEALEEKRKSLRLGLAFHPKAQEILGRLRARPTLQESAKVAVPGVEDPASGNDGRGAGGAG